MNNFWLKLNKPIIALAPMAGVTDTAFRQMCKFYGADVIYTEFVSSHALVYYNKKTRAMLSFAEKERPVVCQIFGREPEIFAKSVKILEEMGFDGIDINFGCPAYKVVKTGGGVSLMRNLNLCFELVQAACANTRLPVSIKVRASIRRGQTTHDKLQDKLLNNNLACSPDIVTALDLVNKIKNQAITAIMLHARSFEKPFDGQPDWPMVKQIKNIWPGILLANGGIHTPETAKNILDDTKADGLGLARGAWGRPWLFKQIKDYLRVGNYEQYDWSKIKPIILQHAQLALNSQGDYGLIELRKHLAWYVRGFSGASEMRKKLLQTKTLDEIKRILDSV